MKPLDITVHTPAGRKSVVPVTGGVPLAQGEAPAGSRFRLTDDTGEPVPLQTEILGTWPDGSARWVLLDFSCCCAGPGPKTFALATGDSGAEPVPAVTAPAGGTTLSNGEVRVAAGGNDGTLLSVPGRLQVEMILVLGDGTPCRAVVGAAATEAAGPVRGTLTLRGVFRDPDGRPVLQFRLRVSAYAGLSALRLEPMVLFDPDAGLIFPVRELRLAVRPDRGWTAARIGGDPGWEGGPGRDVRLFQRDDEQHELQGAEGVGGRAPGWAALNTLSGPVALALRDFWEQWPKSLEVSADGLSLGLLPSFAAGDFAHMEPWYKHQWFFENECYRLRTGQARSWDVWLGLAGEGADLCALAQRPPVPVADPARAIATGVWGAIQPAGTPAMAEYDPWAQALFDGYVGSIEAQHDYGAMNWGDWFGERSINWGNHEYDTTNQLLIQFARTGDPAYLRWAEAAGRHSAEVDTVHHVNGDLAEYYAPWTRPSYPPRPGLVHQHAHGHVGGFMSEEKVRQLLVEHGIGKHSGGRPYSCLDPFNLGHIWTTGMMRLYFLTGNPFLRETVEMIGDSLARLVEEREYRFMGSTHCGRVTGWPLLALGGAYEIGLDDRFVKAMRTLAEEALDMQDPVCGGWIVHPMAADHCICRKERHTGMATFITAVLINGLARYCELSGDDRLPHCIDEAVTYINNDTWRESLRGWRYTSCPGHRTASQPGVVVMAYTKALSIASNPEHLRILRLAWGEKFRRLLENPPAPGPGQGKGYSSTMYGCAEAIGLLAEAAD